MADILVLFRASTRSEFRDRIEVGLDVELLLDDGDEHIGGDSDPDLGLHGILRSAEKRFDVQVLCDPFEKQLYQLTIPVEFGNS